MIPLHQRQPTPNPALHQTLPRTLHRTPVEVPELLLRQRVGQRRELERGRRMLHVDAQVDAAVAAGAPVVRVVAVTADVELGELARHLRAIEGGG